jgi:hypothetical protein
MSAQQDQTHRLAGHDRIAATRGDGEALLYSARRRKLTGGPGGISVSTMP